MILMKILQSTKLNNPDRNIQYPTITETISVEDYSGFYLKDMI